MSGRDRDAPADDDTGTSGDTGFVLWLLSETRPQRSAVDAASARNPTGFAGVGAGASDMAASYPADDPAHGSGPVGLGSPGLRVVLRLPGTRPAHNPPGLPDDDALWQTTRYLAYEIITPDGDIAAIIRLGAEAIHAFDHYSTITLGDDAAATGLGTGPRYEPVSLAGDAVETGLQAIETRRASGRPAHRKVGAVEYYFRAVNGFIFSRDGLIVVLVLMVAYVVIAGLQNLMRSSR